MLLENHLLANLLIKKKFSRGRFLMNEVESTVSLVLVTISLCTFRASFSVVNKIKVDVILYSIIELSKILNETVGVPVVFLTIDVLV